MKTKATLAKGFVVTIFVKIFLIFQLVFCLSGFAQTVRVNNVSPNPVCGGQVVNVTFSTTNGNGNNKKYTSNTVFTVYLSSNGGVMPYTNIGNLTLQPYVFVGGNGAVNANIVGTITLPADVSGAYTISLGSTLPIFDGSTGLGASPSFTINQAPVGGVLSGGTTVCPGSNNVTLILSGHTGSVLKWQSSMVSDFSSNVTDIANTTTTLTTTNLNVTTYFRAVVTNGTCTNNSLSAGIIVDPNAGIISSNQSICSGTSPSDITLIENTGTIQWQRSIDNLLFNDIPGATTSTLTSTQMGVVTITTFYRAAVTGGCGVVNSNVVTVTVSIASVGGTVASDATVCGGNNSMVLTLSGYVGNVVKWQSSSQPNFSSPFDIASTTNTLTVTNITSSTYYRAVVQNGGCPVQNSSKVKITVQNVPNGGTLSGDTTACYGTNNTILTVTGYTNSIVKWQSSTSSDFSGGVVDIINTNPTLSVTNLIQTTYYRVVVANMNCESYSTVAIITVSPMLSAVTTGNNSPVCSGVNAVFNLSGTPEATVVYSINGGTNQTVVLTGGVATVTVIGVTSNQTLSLVSVNFGACSQTVSGVSTVIVNGSNFWTGAVDNQWSNSGNWSCGALPTINTDVVINSATVIVSGIDALANSLTLDATSTLTVESGNNITVYGAVNVASGGIMTMQNNANLLQTNNATNSGNITVNRSSSALMRLDYTLWSSPVAGQNLLNFSPSTLTTRFYIYNSDTNLYSSIVPGSNNFNAASGYLIRMPDNHPATPTIWNGQFSGVPNNGNFTYTMYNGGVGKRFNLVGNPYPSPIDAVAFVGANSANITGTLYFWRKTNNVTPDYCTWTTAGFVSNGQPEVYDPNDVIRTGQGFFVEALNSSTTVDFTNSMRIKNIQNQFFRQNLISNSVLDGSSRVWLNLTNAPGAFSQALIGYFNGATSNIDNGIDGRELSESNIAFGSIINNENFVIQGKALPFNPSDIVPLYYKAPTAGSYTITINQVEGVFMGEQHVYLKDNMTNAIHDLTANSYTFTTEVGTFNNRFELAYQSKRNNENFEFAANGVAVCKNNHQLIVKSEKLIYNIKVFDVGGRLIKVVNDVSASEANLYLDVENEILLVKVTTVDGLIFDKKIVF